MANMFDTGVRFNPSTNEYRGSCVMCGLHQGLQSEDSEPVLNGGWGDNLSALNWVRAHVRNQHQDTAPMEAFIALGISE